VFSAWDGEVFKVGNMNGCRWVGNKLETAEVHFSTQFTRLTRTVPAASFPLSETSVWCIPSHRFDVSLIAQTKQISRRRNDSGHLW